MGWKRKAATGEYRYFPDGAGAPRQVLAPDPIKRQGAVLDNQQAATGIAKSRSDMANDAERLRLERARLMADALKNGFISDGKGGFVRDPSAKPELTPAQRSQSITDFQSSLDLAPIINELDAKFKAGPGQTTGIAGLGSIIDRLPLPRNENFDKAANKLRGFVKRSQGFTGGEGNTATEMQMNIGAFIPASKDYDSTTRQNLNALRNEQQRGLRTAVSVLGGIPDANGYVTPIPTGYSLGKYPDLDVAVAREISRVPVANRQRFLIDAMTRYEQRNRQHKPSRTAPRQAPRKVVDYNDLP